MGAADRNGTEILQILPTNEMFIKIVKIIIHTSLKSFCSAKGVQGGSVTTKQFSSGTNFFPPSFEFKIYFQIYE